MRSSYHCECKFCEAKADYESHWLPVEVLEAFANVWILFHVLRYHPKEMTHRHFIYAVKNIFASAVVVILFVLLTLVQIVCYPLYWLMDTFLY